jgi:hypothetical protein
MSNDKLFDELIPPQPKTETEKAIDAAVEVFRREVETHEMYEYKRRHLRTSEQWEERARFVHDALTKPIRKVLQVDTFTNVVEDSVSKPDDDGDEVSWSMREELRTTECVRIQFPDEWTRADVMRGLAKALECMKSDDFWNYHELERDAMSMMRFSSTFRDAIDDLDMSDLDSAGSTRLDDDLPF